MQIHLTQRLSACHAQFQQEDAHEYCAGVTDLALAVATAHRETLAKNR
jgi:hypothetical protein